MMFRFLLLYFLVFDRTVAYTLSHDPPPFWSDKVIFPTLPIPTTKLSINEPPSVQPAFAPNYSDSDKQYSATVAPACAKVTSTDQSTRVSFPNFKLRIYTEFGHSPLKATEFKFFAPTGEQVYPVSYSGGGDIEKCFDGVIETGGCTTPFSIDLGNQIVGTLLVWRNGEESNYLFKLTAKTPMYRIVVEETNRFCTDDEL